MVKPVVGAMGTLKKSMNGSERWSFFCNLSQIFFVRRILFATSLEIRLITLLLHSMAPTTAYPRRHETPNLDWNFLTGTIEIRHFEIRSLMYAGTFRNSESHVIYLPQLLLLKWRFADTPHSRFSNRECGASSEKLIWLLDSFYHSFFSFSPKKKHKNGLNEKKSTRAHTVSNKVRGKLQWEIRLIKECSRLLHSMAPTWNVVVYIPWPLLIYAPCKLLLTLPLNSTDNLSR